MTENPAVVDGFVDVYNQWVDLGVDGFRIDTAKHVNFEFWQKFTTDVRDHAASIGNDDFFMFGEVYDADPVKLAPYLRDSDMNAVLDFTFQSAASNYAKGFSSRRSGGAVRGRRPVHDADDERAGAAHVPRQPRHGPHRVLRQGREQPGAALRAGALAHVPDARAAGRLLRRRAGLRRRRRRTADKDARQSLFATQVRRVREPEPARRDARGLGRPLRHRLRAVRAHRRAGRAAQRAPGAAARRPDRAATPTARSTRSAGSTPTEKVEHLVATNNGTAATTVTIDTLTPGATFAPLYGTSTGVTAAADGTVSVTIPALSAIVLKAGTTVGAPAAPRCDHARPPRRPAPACRATSPVSADVADDVWSQTSFAYRVVGDDDWTPLGTAETTSPRVFHTVTDLPDGALVEYRAVTVDAAGPQVRRLDVRERRRRRRRRRRPRPGPGRGPRRHRARQPQHRDGLPGRLAARVRGRAQLTKGADGIYSGTFTLPAGQLRVQGRDRRLVGRELRRGRRRRAARTSRTPWPARRRR